MSEPASRVWVIFSEALEMGDPGTRAAYLQAACGGDEDLIREIEELLQADTKAAAGFLPERVRQSEPKPAFEAEQAEAWLSERIGAYKLIEKLGEGGCGVVYLAQQEEPVRRKVALKLIRPGMDTKRVIARFEAERQALALMDHPWIAKVFDAGTTQTGHPFFAMELVPGMKLTRFCNERQFSVRQRLELFLRVCQAVQHAHQKGVIHRDLKPSNILVSDQDGEAVPKIIDFGIAKATQGPASMDLTSVTGFEQLVGTPAYMSPEQAAFSGVNMDTRRDIYSLGVVLYELVTGLTPFDNKRLQQASFEELQRIIGDEEPPRPSAKYQHLNEGDQLRVASEHGSEPGKLLRLIRGDLEWVIMKSLEKDPNRRYPTVNGLASDIQRYLRNEPILARPPNQLYRLRKVAQRHKTAFAAGAAVL